MAAPLVCDICQGEPGVQMLSNLSDGATMIIGAACAGDFYHQMLIRTLDASQHEGPRTKCAACRRFHEHGTGGVVAIGAADDQAPDVADDQAPDVAMDATP